MTPTTPESFTAMAGRNCDADAGAEVSIMTGALHDAPRSDDHTTAIRGLPPVHRMSGNAAYTRSRYRADRRSAAKVAVLSPTMLPPRQRLNVVSLLYRCCSKAGRNPPNVAPPSVESTVE